MLMGKDPVEEDDENTEGKGADCLKEEETRENEVEMICE